MENSNTWNRATQLIADAVGEHDMARGAYNGVGEEIGLSLAAYIARRLEVANHLTPLALERCYDCSPRESF